VGVCIVNLRIYRQIIMATIMHCIVGSSHIHGHAWMGTQSNTQEVTSANLSHSGATYLQYETECTLIVACRIFRNDFCPLVMYMLMKSLTIKNKSKVMSLLQKVEVLARSDGKIDNFCSQKPIQCNQDNGLCYPE